MEQMLVEELNSDINAVRDKLRETDDKIGTLSGRVPRHQRISYGEIEDTDTLNTVDRKSFGLDDRRITINRDYKRDSTGGAIKRRIQVEDRIDRRRSTGDQFKRQRVDYLEDENEYDDDSGKRPKKSVQSTVVMPALDSKGRDEKIEKLKETENKEVKNRNRRMFSNLIGTLTNFKKTDRKTQQQTKQEAVEKKLEENKKKDEEQRHHEKVELIQKRRGQEKELYQLQRKKALIQYADIKINQLKMLRGSIKTTSCNPKIFWQPVRHTIRSMELLQATEKEIDELIKQREDQLNQDLVAKDQRNENEQENDGNEGEDEYEDENEEKIEVVVNSSSKSSRDVRIENDGHTEVKIDMEVDDDVHFDFE